MGVVVPICAMKGGQNLHQYVDLLVPTQAKFSLLQGEGPIHLVGSHCVDFFGYRETEDDAEDESAEEDTEMEGVEEKSTAEDKKKTPTKESGDEKKRKASADVPKSAEKKKKESPAK